MKRLAQMLIGITVIFIPFSSYTKTYKMIFWYPGEAGSESEAQPILDNFFEYINKRLQGDKIEGRYFPTEVEGNGYIKSNRPQLGIFSLMSYIKASKEGLPMKIIAETRPLPDGMSTQKYYLVGPKAYKDTKKIPKVIFSSEPLSQSFVQNVLFNNIKFESLYLSSSRNTLNRLKSISQGEDVGVILTEAEYMTLSRMSAPWVKDISTISPSAPVPTAPVVSLFSSTDDPLIPRLKSIILKMSRDAEARPILQSLRLYGFAEADISAYDAVVSKCR